MDHKKSPVRRQKRQSKALEENFWDCSVCTYRNTAEAFKCLMCDVRKEIFSNLLDVTQMNEFQRVARFYNMGVSLTNSTFHEPTIQSLIHSKEKFDLIIMEVFINEAMLGFANVFNAPIIGVSTFGASILTSEMVGTPSPPSYVPSFHLSLTDKMSLSERLHNLVLTTYEKVYNDFVYMPDQEKIYEQFFPNPKPNLRDIRRNTSLVLLNNHFSLSYPRPYVPNMIEVGGMHISRTTKPLPLNIQKFLDSAKDGAIYFSMGSNLKSKDLPKEKLLILLNTFKSLPQKVLCKWEAKEMPNKPENVLISDWFPQNDILVHPAIKLFITHGGLLGTTEAIYHGVPVVGIPMFGDQFMNMAMAERKGYGLSVDYNNLTENILKSTIVEALTNPKYTQKIKEMSARYRDQPMNPLETAIFWVEYVVRHKGAYHLHSSGQDLSFAQYHNLDIFAIFISIIVFVIFILSKVFNFLCRKVRTPKDKKQKVQ